MEDFDSLLQKIALAKSIDLLSIYNGLNTPADLAETIALQSIAGFTNIIPTNQLRPPEYLTNIVKDLVNTNDGCFTTFKLIKRINDQLVGQDQRMINDVGKFVKIYYVPNSIISEQNPWFKPVLNEIRITGDGQGIINSSPNSPSKNSPSLSLIKINSVLLNPSAKYSNILTVFLNSLPSLEIQKAVPFVKVNFMFDRNAIDENGQIHTLNIVKFLEGAVEAGNGIRRLLTEGSSIEGRPTDRNNSGRIPIVGNEIFSMPQTFVNANESFDQRYRTVPVIDKFRPLLTFKELSIDIAPAAGMMSYKTAKLNFVLHDRSRLHEIADFIKPDMYGGTEILLEYGWNHPEKPGHREGTNDNHYANLINGMRCKEKYGIRNIQASMDEAGQINLVLDLFMKGSNEFHTETIDRADDTTNHILREIERLVSIVNSFRERYFNNNGQSSQQQSNSSNRATREIRGIQILNAASDYQGNLRLSPDTLRNLREFQEQLRSYGNRVPNASALRNSLNQLFENRSSNRNNGGDASGGQIAQLSTTIQRNLERKILNATRNTVDISQSTSTRESRLQLGRNAENSTRTSTSRNNRVNEAALDANLVNSISLGKLMLLFVGEPLAATHKFDDVQFIFYPFNQYAGRANTLNISEFRVDTRFFIRQLTRFRTENLARTSNMSLHEFLGFIRSTILDDYGAESYGIYSLFGRFTNEAGDTELRAIGENRRVVDSVEHQRRMENLLSTVTPDGSFKMPQIEFHVETLNGKVNDIKYDLDKSILRIHVYDKQCSQYDSQANLLASSRNNVLREIGSIPQTNQSLLSDPGVYESHVANSTHIIDLARRNNLIELIRDRNGNTSQLWRLRGGPKLLKEFIMSTMPYILFGIQGSAIVGNANLSSQNDAALSTINMLRSYRGSPVQSNGEQPGGLPLSIIPGELSMQVLGCPLLDFAQQFFIDFNTGTTWDNIYGITSLSHKILPGDFKTDVKLVTIDAYGRYDSMIRTVNNAANVLSLNDRTGNSTV